MSQPTTIIGTSCFVSIRAARAYYARQGFTAADVKDKLARHEIRLGPPNLKPGQRWRVNAEGRYLITELAPAARASDAPQEARA